jgi:hypothetical protein
MANEDMPIQSRRPDGLVTGFVRTDTGEPVARTGLLPYPTSSIAASLKEKVWLTRDDGSYRLPLPAGTYTIRVISTSASGESMFGEVTGVVVTAHQETPAVDIVLTEQELGPEYYG